MHLPPTLQALRPPGSLEVNNRPEWNSGVTGVAKEGIC